MQVGSAPRASLPSYPDVFGLDAFGAARRDLPVILLTWPELRDPAANPGAGQFLVRAGGAGPDRVSGDEQP